ncbi:MAG: hypothetical protein HY784_01050 [Chloroflexi bacterium]|nr:hypothetical protein [Chloroflexota bacterium]
MVLLALGAVFLAQPLAYLGEKKLVALWPSGRALELEAGALSLREKSGTVRVDLSPAGKVNFWRWRFVVRGRQGGRVPNGHHCFAIHLVQNDASFSLYAFLSPKQADALAARYAFYELRRATEAGKRTLSGREAVYVAAKKKRWEAGAELDPADFETLLAHLAAHVAEFAATSAS